MCANTSKGHLKTAGQQGSWSVTHDYSGLHLLSLACSFFQSHWVRKDDLKGYVPLPVEVTFLPIVPLPDPHPTPPRSSLFILTAPHSLPFYYLPTSYSSSGPATPHVAVSLKARGPAGSCLRQRICICVYTYIFINYCMIIYYIIWNLIICKYNTFLCLVAV